MEKKTSSNEKEIKKAYTIGVSFGIITILFFCFLAYLVSFITRSFDPFTGLFPLIKGDTLKYALLGTSVAVSLLIRLIRYLLPSGKISIYIPTRVNIFSETVQRLLLTSIITFAFCALVSLFGIAVFLVTGHSLDFYIFLVLALILLATNFPGYHDWNERVKKFSSEDGDNEQKNIEGKA